MYIFYARRPPKCKRYWRLDWVLTLWGATGVKAARKYVDEIDPCYFYDFSRLVRSVANHGGGSRHFNSWYYYFSKSRFIWHYCPTRLSLPTVNVCNFLAKGNWEKAALKIICKIDCRAFRRICSRWWMDRKSLQIVKLFRQFLSTSGSVIKIIGVIHLLLQSFTGYCYHSLMLSVAWCDHISNVRFTKGY